MANGIVGPSTSSLEEFPITSGFRMEEEVVEPYYSAISL
jgi:hypothetical protein